MHSNFKKYFKSQFKKVLYLFIGVAILFILVPVGLWGYQRYQDNHTKPQVTDENGHPQTTILHKNQTPNGKKRKKVPIKSVSEKAATKNVKNSIQIGLKIISDNKITAGQNINISNLNKKDTKQLYRSFQNGSVVQQFNDIVNYSTPKGYVQWGDAGSKSTDTSIKTPKPGDEYVLDGGDIHLTSSNVENYFFKVNLTYHAGDQPQRTIPLKLTVNRIAGQVTNVKRIGEVKINN